MAQTKYLDYAGLQLLLTKLFERKFKGLGLSQENFTTDLKSKYDALVAASSVEDLTALFNRVSELEALINADSDGAINKFNEIVAFLAGVGESDTLEGKLAGIATQIADAKKAGTDAASALNNYKTTVSSTYVAKETGKGLSSNDYTDTDKAAVGTIGGKVDKVDGKGLSSNDYTTAEKNAVATIANKVNASDLVAVTTAEITALLA